MARVRRLATLCVVLMTVSNSENRSMFTSTFPHPQLECFSLRGNYTNCNGFCGWNTVQSSFIGNHDNICPASFPGGGHSQSEMENTLWSSTPQPPPKDSLQCIHESAGCGIEWLCLLLLDENAQSCATASLLFNLHALQCVPVVNGAYATTLQYTKFNLQQYCCESDNCYLAGNVTCSSNAIYQQYNDDLFRCSFSESAVDNKFQRVSVCDEDIDSNEYSAVCEYLISQTYATNGCPCKSSFLIGHQYPAYTALIDDWNVNELEPQITELQQHGCASNVWCTANQDDDDDDAFVGGVLTIEMVLYRIWCEVYLPHSLIHDNLVADIQSRIDTNAERIYVTLSENDRNDESVTGRVVNVLVALLNATERDALYEQWTGYTNVTRNAWFGNGSVIRSVQKMDVNESLQFYGSDPYYPRETRNREAALAASIAIAVCMIICLAVIIAMCANHKRKPHDSKYDRIVETKEDTP